MLYINIVMDFMKDIYKFTFDKFIQIPYLNEIEKKYNIKKEHLFIITMIFGFYYFIFGKTVEYVSRLFSVLYPGYESYLCLESKDYDKDGKKWLIYWIVNAGIISFETLGWMLINLIPFYHLTKIVFIYWLVAPNSNGCFIVYNKFIEPYLKENKESIDGIINNTIDTIDKMKKNLTKEITNEDQPEKNTKKNE